MTVVICDVETSGLDPLNNEIVAIGIRANGVSKIFARNEKTTEAEILSAFWDELQTIPHPILVGFNLPFDWQMIKLRSVRHKLVIHHLDKYSERIDLRLVLNSDRYARGTKLGDYCKCFEIPDNDDIDGSQIPLLFMEGHYHKVRAHLEADLVKTEALFKRMQECGVIA